MYKNNSTYYLKLEEIKRRYKMQEKKYISLIIIVVIVIIVILGLLIALKQEGNTIANNQQNQSGEILNNIEEIPSIEKYEYNQYQVQTIENHSMCNIYFNNYYG